MVGSRIEVKVIVFSTEGLTARDTASLLTSLKAKLEDWGYEHMMGRIGLDLVQARGRSFEIGP